MFKSYRCYNMHKVCQICTTSCTFVRSTIQSKFSGSQFKFLFCSRRSKNTVWIVDATKVCESIKSTQTLALRDVILELFVTSKFHIFWNQEKRKSLIYQKRVSTKCSEILFLQIQSHWLRIGHEILNSTFLWCHNLFFNILQNGIWDWVSLLSLESVLHPWNWVQPHILSNLSSEDSNTNENVTWE